MTCDTQSCIKHSTVDGDIIMHKLPKDEAVRANAVIKNRKQ